MKYILSITLFLFLSLVSISQHQELQEIPKIWQNDLKNNPDSTNILSAFKSGKVNGHFRYFSSSIINKGNLTDYYANAVGGGLRFETGSFHGVTLGISGFYIFNVASSDLSKKDVVSGQSNRYEIGLFDVSKPDDLSEINRVEELYVRYQTPQTKITFGRQLLNTPFINLQDGRIRPTAVEGVWIEKNIQNGHTFQLGWLYNIAPRSTRIWYDIKDSFGVYPTGVNENGTKSNYQGNVNTNGVLLSNYQYKNKKNLTLNIWNMWVENVMNTTLFQVDKEWPITNGKIYVGGQTSMQMKSGNGGNESVENRYYTNTKKVFIFGGRLGWKNPSWDHSLNFNRITSGGRYLIPREWGRDYFYTFMPRERNEGFGDVFAFAYKSNYNLSKKTSVQMALGVFLLPDIKDYTLNKYGMPSYSQFNLDFRHKFSGLLQGLEGQLLYVLKSNVGETYEDPRYIIHKVDMHLFNVVFNFRF